VGGARAEPSKNVRSTSIFKSIKNLLAIGSGVGETVILASSVGISSELKSSEFRSSPDPFFEGVTFSHRASICRLGVEAGKEDAIDITIDIDNTLGVVSGEPPNGGL
jgi:hypothetical protein